LLKRLSIAMQPTVILRPEQIAAFHEQGFLTLPEIAPPGELELMRNVFSRLFEQRAGRAEGAQYDIVSHDGDEEESALPTIINPLNYAPELRRLQYRANALAIARQLLGPTVTPSFEHAILKPPHFGAATPWHQDEAYRVDSDFEYQQLSIWMCLQDATLENGCMHYIPGSNHGGVLPHRSPRNDPKVHAIECADGFDAATAMPCPIPAGGATMHHGKTLHYAGPNSTNAPRCAYILAFEVPPKPLTAARDFYWNREKQNADLLRRRQWRRRGGIVVEAARKVRQGLWRSPRRVAFELRRALRALRTWD
jgi:ectoine hydroxylase-related dioxygenase (phytanoyl-CoA dioxygenase family)